MEVNGLVAYIVCFIQLYGNDHALRMNEYGLMDNDRMKKDWRDISNGAMIPVGQAIGDAYADQPYIVETNDGAWLIVVTTGGANEGEPGQHVVSLRSTNQGQSWEPAVAVEPAGGPEASYAVLLKVPSGRVYVFYNHNTDNVRKVPCEIPLPPEEVEPGGGSDHYLRVDSLGYFVFKYSDDDGRSWSQRRYVVDVRDFEYDRSNADNGRVRYFWNVGRPFIGHGGAYIPLTKIGGFGPGFFARTEGALIKSENILREDNPEKICFQTLPDGDYGLRAPAGGGPIAEEQSYALLSDGSLYCTYRCVDGHPVCAYSRDGGHSWDAPEYKTYSDGRRVKHPRAANFVWKHSSGCYLYWFHNHGGKDYKNRNPVWLLAGKEFGTDGQRKMLWSEPEVLFYAQDVFRRISYPDMIESGKDMFITETEKCFARVHQVDPDFLGKILGQFDSTGVCKEGLLVEHKLDLEPDRLELPAPELPALYCQSPGLGGIHGIKTGNGFSFDLWIDVGETLCDPVLLFDSRTDRNKGMCLSLAQNGSLTFEMGDGRQIAKWVSQTTKLCRLGMHHIGVVVDGGPNIITIIVDGVFLDGGDELQFGFSLFDSMFQSANGGNLVLSDSKSVQVRTMRIYGRALMTCEIRGNCLAGKEQSGILHAVERA